VTITSFGYLHGAPPSAHLTIDTRAHFKDPHAAPELRHLDATDGRVYDAVLSTPGAWDLAMSAASVVPAFLAGPAAGPVAIAIGCAGGRHRGPAIAIAVYGVLANWGIIASVCHRDIGKPVVSRDLQAAGSVAS
jgi:UPF0042 nucleotide-binding protein